MSFTTQENKTDIYIIPLYQYSILHQFSLKRKQFTFKIYKHLKAPALYLKEICCTFLYSVLQSIF